jgi:hypothetical protein
MLRSMKDTEAYTIGAVDGIVGRVRDFYFDDAAWSSDILSSEPAKGRRNAKC